ncbi:MAG: single-stranded DNA-binding protein [Chlamydiia bacterium]
MNFVFIAGRLGSDPETRTTPSGKKVTSFRVACSSKKGGEEETTWFNITVWGDQFDKLISFLKKGSAVMIQGELQKPKTYKDREGRDQVSLNVTASNISFSPFGKSDGSSSNNQKSGHSNNSSDSNGFDSNSFNFEPVMQGSQHPAFQDDEIPF